MTAPTALTAAEGARPADAPPKPLRALRFPGLEGALLMQDAPEVEDALRRILRGWFPRAADAGPEDADTALGTIIGMGDGRHVATSPWLDAPMDRLPAASAACCAVADLAQAFFHQRPGTLALHCGAARIGGRLIAFGGPARTGKSTLISRLSAEADIEVLTDDVLPVLADGMAFGLGVLPRLRLPLPDAASPVFRAHVDRHLAASDKRYGYVDAPTVAPHGTRAALRVFVVLSRGPGARATFHRIDLPEVMRHMIARNMTRGPGVFGRLAALAEGLTCLRLVYEDLEEAVDLIRRAFAGPGLDIDILPPIPEPRDPVETRLPPADPAQVWARAAQVALRRVAGDAFLWNAATGRHFHLNAVAAAVWTLLEDPLPGGEIAAVLAEAFEDAEPAQVTADVAVLLSALSQEGLVVPA
ncbi:MAG TPA: PqqD family protein [Paracoccaceae bacterium]|nr:PqqD family protein [Paracoccaceae bacterium]